jgi:Ulp1 family protease
VGASAVSLNHIDIIPSKIYILDSLRGGHSDGFEGSITAYLSKKAIATGELLFRRHKVQTYDIMVSQRYWGLNIYSRTSQVPEQPNSDDCGYYMLHFLMEFLKDPEKYQALMTVSDQAMNMEGSNWHSGTITRRYGGKVGLSQQDEEEDAEYHSRKDQ